MNKYSTDYNNTIEDNKNDEVDLREIIFKYLRYWKWFIVSIIVFLAIGVLVYMKMERKYQITSSVLLKEEKGSGAMKNSPLGSLQDLGLLSTTNNVDNEIAVFSSPNLLKQVILKLEIQATYFQKGIFRDTEVYNECPYYVRLEDIKPDDLQGSIEITLSKRGDGVLVSGAYRYKKDNVEFKNELDQLPGFIELPNGLGKLYITLRPNIDKELLDENYVIYIDNAQRIAYAYASKIKIAPTTKQSSVLNISLDVENINKGIDILKELTRIYNINNVEDNNQIAVNTSNFVDGRLSVITRELEDVENQVVTYKEEQKITDVSSEAKLFLEQTSTIQEKKTAVETQLKTIEMVDDFIKNKENDYKLIPSLSIADPGLAQVIVTYNNFLLEYERLNKSTSENNPSRIRAKADLENMRENIISSVSTVKRAIVLSKQELDRQIGQLTARVYSVPNQEKGLLEIMRQQQVKQALYLYLMQVKEETNITMASTSDKAKMITDPIIPESPISPRRNLILLTSFLLGLIIPIGVVYIKDLLQITITNREELEKIAQPTVIGEIMKKEEDSVLVVEANKTTPIVELFRSLRNNLQFVLDSPDKKVLLVTSTIPGEGKTFVSINLACSFNLSDKKILLIGMDIRNPKLAADMGFPKGEGLTSYLAGSVKDWHSLLSKVKQYPNLDILQAGAIPPNPNELLMKSSLNELLEQARKEYDIILIDSAPVGVVSDTLLLSNLADATVYVTREGVTPKNAINFINTLYNEKKLPHIYIVLNGVETAKGGGRYGRYSYGYGKTYGYAQDKKD